MNDASTRTLKPKKTAALPLAEDTLRLTVDRIIVTGLELAPNEAQRFEALLVAELERLLAEQFAINGADIQNETLRSDWGAIVMEMDHPASLNEVAHEVARRLSLALQTAAQKGAAG